MSCKVLHQFCLTDPHHLYVLSLIGATVVFAFVFKIFCSVIQAVNYGIVGYLELNISWKKMGKWAVVTGGTEGLGKAYAEVLAQKGFSIVLLSRTQAKLDAVAEHIRNVYSVDTQVICVDFTDGPEIYDKIQDKVRSLEIGVLVNNVGMSYEHAEYFHAIPSGQKFIENMIRVNIVSCTMLMKLILPQMVRRKRGVIINISSLTALYPMPLLAVYAACKTYVDYLTQAIQVEYKAKGIVVQSVLPGYVATNMSKLKRTSLEVPLPETFVHSAIKTVGTEHYTYGYLPHKIRGYMHEVLRAYFPEKINMNIELHIMSKVRERYYRKLERSKKE